MRTGLGPWLAFLLLLATSCGRTPLRLSSQAGGAGAGGATAEGGTGWSTAIGGVPGTGGISAAGGVVAAGGTLGAGGTATTVSASGPCCKSVYCPSGDTLVTTCPTGASCYQYIACGCNQVLCARATGSDGSAGTGGSNATGGGFAGATGTGGTTGSGGTTSSGGMTARGGTTSAGGTTVAGGTTASGGSTGGAACTGTFVAGSLLPLMDIGKSTHAVAAGDLDGDGNLDLVVATDWWQDTVSVLLGKGDGTFAAPVDYATGSRPFSVVLGDLNGDDKLDIVTGNDSFIGASVLLGRGDGTFAANQDYDLVHDTSAVALADFNGDGKLDLVTANETANTVSVLLGKGDGTFAANVDHAVGMGPSAVLTGDLNGDGTLDLVVAYDWTSHQTSSVSVLLGKGDGTFTTKVEDALVGAPDFFRAALGDVNGDGHQDLIIALRLQGSVGVFLGKGDGTFADPVDYPGESFQSWVALSDVNGDGKPDIVVAGDGVSVLFGQGDGTFAAKVDSPVSPYLGFTLGDFNGDGKPDLAVTATVRYTGDAVGVLLGSGVGTFGISTTFPTGGQPNSVVLGDLDRDGRLDIVTANGYAGTVSVLLGRGNGRFAPASDYAAGTAPASVVLGDVDGDSKLDIAVADGSAVGVLLGKGDGTFGTEATYATQESTAALALGDVNGDGKLDIVTANTPNQTDPGTVSVLLGTGGGRFAAHVDYDAGYEPQSVALGDVNRDGKLDIVVANAGWEYNQSVGVLLGKGDGTFSPQVTYLCGGGPVAVALGDLNGDGNLDIVTINTLTSPASASVLLGEGDGTFAKRVDYGMMSDSASSVVLVDVNGDGALDIVTANHLPTAATVLFGRGDGTFPSSATYPVNASAVAVGDLNADGRQDLVAAGGDSVQVLFGSCR